MEEYRDVIGFEGVYQVSNHGNIRCWKRKKKEWKPLNPTLHSNGYRRVKLRNRGINKDQLMHILVALAFIENTDGKPCVNHIDLDKSNNHVSNLEWATHHENASHFSLSNEKTSSRFVGVNRKKKKFVARLMVNGKRKHLGSFNCETSAHVAYLTELKKHSINHKYVQ